MITHRFWQRERSVDMAEQCELLEICGYFIKYQDSKEAACKGFIQKYCKGPYQNKCKRKEYRILHGEPPIDDMMPSGHITANLKIWVGRTIPISVKAARIRHYPQFRRYFKICVIIGRDPVLFAFRFLGDDDGQYFGLFGFRRCNSNGWPKVAHQAGVENISDYRIARILHHFFDLCLWFLFFDEIRTVLDNGVQCDESGCSWSGGSMGRDASHAFD